MKSAIVVLLLALAMPWAASAADVAAMSVDDVNACVEKNGPQHSSVQSAVVRTVDGDTVEESADTTDVARHAPRWAASVSVVTQSLHRARCADGAARLRARHQRPAGTIATSALLDELFAPEVELLLEATQNDRVHL